MEGGDLFQCPTEVLRKINGFIRALVVDLGHNQRLSIAVDRHRIFCSDSSGNCFCSSDLPYGIEIVSLEKEGHACRLYILLRVLMIIQQLLLENKHGSKRDIYYMEQSIFTGACRKRAYMIPVCVEEVEDILSHKVDVIDTTDIVSVAQYILVVEKESVFQRLANDKFCERHHCIVITGRGYPDVPTRRFLRLLVKELHLPAYCLVDFDPYGFDILTIYRFGSMQMSYDAKLLRVSEIRWLGVFFSDLERYQLPERCLLTLTTEDKKKVEAMLSRCYLHQEAPQWRLELEMMLHKGVKFEIEALAAYSLSILADAYIPRKIQGGHI
ncbi:meiotic recombination protein SPO11-1 isoform X4 [Phalaenopsis equestris]|uniref:meiotic recombination protein SPO11-1 isoform X4 n=1 Tax=Phalaenopsis equestris TaxID=78828 RepID=UPI0009E2148A|nr:meiotic recombination protein SPO11-1 isoform X4 [Phalaenopsis equestris]